MSISEITINLFTLLLAPAAIIIGIIATLVFLIIRKINNIDKILNEINNHNKEEKL